MYAVVQTGGKQVRVAVGDVVQVEYQAGEVGSDVVFDRVVLLGGDQEVKVGAPTVEGAQVRGKVVEQGRGDKILIYTYKRRKNSARRTQGHRQSYTAVQIEAIEA